MRNSLLLLALLLAGCGSTPSTPVVIQPETAQLPPPPPDVMVQREADFLERLLNFLSEKPAAPTK